MSALWQELSKKQCKQWEYSKQKEKKFIFILFSSCTKKKTEKKDSRKILYIVYFTTSAETRQTRETIAVRRATVTLFLRQGKHSPAQHKIAKLNELDKGVRSAFIAFVALLQSSALPTRFLRSLRVFCFHV